MANKNDILNAIGEAREKIILNKYNDAMMLMAQITIDLISYMVDEALIVSKGYEEDIKTLNANNYISDNTAHNFSTLIISGVQAHSGVDIPKEHAEKAFEVLSNETDKIFSSELNANETTDDLDSKAEYSANNDKQIYEYDESSEPYPGDYSRDMTMDGGTPAFMNAGIDDDDFRKKEKMREEMLSSERKGKRRPISKLIAIIAPIAALLLLVIGVKAMFFSGGGSSKKVTATTTAPIDTTEVVETEPVETETTLPKEAGYYEVTGDLVKIRDAATTEGSKVKGTVSKGDKVQVKSFYNNDWAIVQYQGKEAYISRRYIKKDESLTQAVIEEETTE